MFTCSPDQHVRLLKSCAGMLLLLLSLPAALTHALPDDRDQPIHITADKALRDEKKGVTIYSGNVQMVQGSLELEADTLTIYPHLRRMLRRSLPRAIPPKCVSSRSWTRASSTRHAKVITYFRSRGAGAPAN